MYMTRELSFNNKSFPYLCSSCLKATVSMFSYFSHIFDLKIKKQINKSANNHFNRLIYEQQ